MKSIRAHVHDFRSINDSREFDVGELTFLFGKNKAGKTAILRALHGQGATDGFTYERFATTPYVSVKKIEAACKPLTTSVPDFGHYVPAEWLMRNLSVLDGDT